MLAFVGTIVSMIGTALLIYVAGFSPSIYSLSLVESLTFGALISATDPVTTLAIFQSVHGKWIVERTKNREKKKERRKKLPSPINYRLYTQFSIIFYLPCVLHCSRKVV